MQPTQDYKQLLTDVIKKQIVILGPDITLSKARNVKGLTVTNDGTVTSYEGSPQEVTQALIDQFVQLSGLIVKKTMEPLLLATQQNVSQPQPIAVATPAPAQVPPVTAAPQPVAPVQAPVQTSPAPAQVVAPQPQVAPAQPVAPAPAPAQPQTQPGPQEPLSSGQKTDEPLVQTVTQSQQPGPEDHQPVAVAENPLGA